MNRAVPEERQEITIALERTRPLCSFGSNRRNLVIRRSVAEGSGFGSQSRNPKLGHCHAANALDAPNLRRDHLCFVTISADKLAMMG